MPFSNIYSTRPKSREWRYPMSHPHIRARLVQDVGLWEIETKKFQCVRCGHADHTDVNASFNIGNPVSHCLIDPARIKSMSQLHKERDLCKGSTDTPLRQRRYKMAMPKMMVTVEPTMRGLS